MAVIQPSLIPHHICQTRQPGSGYRSTSASRLPPAAAPSTGPPIAIATGRSADRLGRGDGRRVQRRLHIWRGRKAWDLRGLGFVDRAGLGQGDHAGDGPDSIDGYQNRTVEDGRAAGFRLDRDL